MAELHARLEELEQRLERVEAALRAGPPWALRLPAVPVTFEDVAVQFSAEEWASLDDEQKDLYRTVMEDNYASLVSVYCALSKPELLSRIERGEEPCAPVELDLEGAGVSPEPPKETLLPCAPGSGDAHPCACSAELPAGCSSPEPGRPRCTRHDVLLEMTKEPCEGSCRDPERSRSLAVTANCGTPHVPREAAAVPADLSQPIPSPSCPLSTCYREAVNLNSSSSPPPAAGAEVGIPVEVPREEIAAEKAAVPETPSKGLEEEAVKDSGDDDEALVADVPKELRKEVIPDACRAMAQAEPSCTVTSPGQPLESPGEPVESFEEPVESLGPSVESTAEHTGCPGEPVESLEEPVESPVEPVESPGEPTESTAEPVEALGVPVESPAEPVECPGEPVESLEEPVESPGKAMESLREPMESLEKLTESPAEPMESPGEPMKSPKEPVESSAEPMECPGEPMKSPKEPVESSAEPVESPGEPMKSPREPVESSAEPVESPAEPVHGSCVGRPAACQRNSTREKCYSCPVCQKNFLLKINLTIHQRSHSNWPPYICVHCDQSFMSKAKIRCHLRVRAAEGFCQLSEAEESSSQGPCPDRQPHDPGTDHGTAWEKPSPSRYPLSPGKMMYTCNECMENFSSQSFLILHQRRHTKRHRILCPCCNRSFTWASDFVRHHWTHTGERPYQCGVCQKTFKRRYHLNVHQRTHVRQQRLYPREDKPPVPAALV
ncbi:zinc finger protein 783-like isoform X2 [Columba livia]|uniref:zinc finger protein 783-like isoform X2 n=1 Tax=Columba livia TaxID=8932 RepID=UPI0031BB93FD